MEGGPKIERKDEEGRKEGENWIFRFEDEIKKDGGREKWIGMVRRERERESEDGGFTF